MKNAENTPSFTNIEPAGTWMAPMSLRERWIKLVWRIGIGFAAIAWLFPLHFQGNDTSSYMVWGFGGLAVSIFFGLRAFRVHERRIFDTIEVRYSQTQRLKRASHWFLAGFAMPPFIWGLQLINDHFYLYWWYAWPALALLAVGSGLYLVRCEHVLSVSGLLAFERVKQERNAKFEAFASSGFVRYISAAGCVYAAYWLATETQGKNNGWGTLAYIVFALILAREISGGLIFYGLVCIAGWTLFAGVSALPLGVAVIIGAYIIAGAISKK